ncbi:TniQ family protein [Chitinimonas sp.]|uniref:TniQ family protein n=1 Tax=Chitinimonas sp. TaxID=1934313 RepID=UPI0035B04858
MHVPSLLPDELHLGFVGRVMRLNGFTDTASFRKNLLRMLPGAREVSIETIATLAKMPLGRYAYHHSLMPFLHAIRLAHQAQYTHEDVTAWYGNVARLGRLTDEVSLCPGCVAEDEDFWGFTYWRRSHQIPGIDICPKHGSALHRMTRTGALHPPAQFLNKAVAVDSAIVAQARSNEIVRRYQEICLLFLERGSPLPVDQVRAHLINRSTELGLRACEVGKRPVLSDLIEEKAAGPRLWANFPGLEGRAKGKFHHPVDGIMRGSHVAYPAQAYALGLACLFDSAEEALLAMSQPIPKVQGIERASLTGLPSEERTPNDHRLIRATRAFLLGGSLLEVCEQYHVTLAALETMLRGIGMNALGGSAYAM